MFQADMTGQCTVTNEAIVSFLPLKMRQFPHFFLQKNDFLNKEIESLPKKNKHRKIY